MKKLYLIRREDFFNAYTLGQIPENSNFEMGSIWGTIALTEEEKNNYGFAICLAYSA